MSENERADIHLHLDALTINVVHTVKADDALTALIQSIHQEIKQMSTTVQEAIDALTAEVAAETTADQSAIALIQGIPALIAAAVAAAQAAGATPAQLAAFDALNATLT